MLFPLSFFFLKKEWGKEKKGVGWGCSSVVEHLPSMPEALGLVKIHVCVGFRNGKG
jgi:hypothetical protein